MKVLIVICCSLLLSGCSSLTRLMPKLEKIDLPEELMVPPKELKTIEKPAVPPQADSKQDVAPKGK